MPSLYHYTDINAVQSILKARILRLTDTRFLNDSTEFTKGIQELRKALSSRQEAPPLLDLASNKDLLNTAISHIDTFLNEASTQEFQNNRPTFVTSFSRAYDSLSQWRAYGLYSIEFDSELLEKTLELHCQLEKCKYDEFDLINFSPESIEEAIAEVLFNLENDVEDLELSIYITELDLLYRAASIKDNAFRVEEEERLIICVGGKDAQIKFRIRDNMLVPYFETSEFPPECIKSITVGPMQDQDLAIKSLELFTFKLSKTKEYKGHKIKVNSSSTPYRG